MQILVDKNKCTGCGICKEDCPKGQKIWVINDKAKATNLRYCHVCTICASKCPEQAITIVRDVKDDETIQSEKANIRN
jgi:Pyruvate/2-oxoacid:ferredoxin oxidoreductase delta subunit